MAYDSKRQLIVLFGGMSMGVGNVGADTWEWNGAAWTQQAEPGPTARQSHVMAYDSNRDRSVLFGGFEHQTGMALADTWEWNGSMWTRISGFGATRCMLAALAFKGDSVALFGGVDPILPAAVASFGSTWTWDGKHWPRR